MLLNEFLLANTDKKKKHIKPFYPDNNLGDLDNFIIVNFRRQNTFSYLTWKIIDQISKKKCSMLDFSKLFVT